MSTLLDKKLAEWRESKVLVSIENPHDPDRFSVGRVDLLESDFIAMTLFDKAGRFDGYRYYRREYLGRVFVGSRYSSMLADLIKGSGEDPPPPPSFRDFHSLVAHLAQEKTGVQLRDNHDTVLAGFISESDGEYLQLTEFHNAALAGHILIAADNIEAILIGSPDLRMLDDWIMGGSWRVQLPTID